MHRTFGVSLISLVLAAMLGCGGGDAEADDLEIQSAATGVPWVVEAVPLQSSLEVAEVAMSLDASGAPHALVQLSSVDTKQQSLLYATRGPQGWRTQVVAAGAHRGLGISVGPDGRVHVAYVWYAPKGFMTSLKYGFLADGAFEVEDIDPNHDAWGWVSTGTQDWTGVDFQVDAWGAVKLLAHGKGRLYYATRSDGAWEASRVDVPGYLTGSPQIAVDSKGTPHIAVVFDNGYSDTTAYARRADASVGWQWVHAFSQGREVRLAIDRSDAVHLLFADMQPDNSRRYGYATAAAGVAPTPDESASRWFPAASIPLVELAASEPRTAHLLMRGGKAELVHGEVVEARAPEAMNVVDSPMSPGFSVPTRVAIAADAAGPRILMSQNTTAERLKYLTPAAD